MNQASLVDYGIHTEQSDVRVHVCPAVRRVYVYPTASGVAVVMTGNYPLRQAYQPGWPEPTAEGYLVPPEDIPNCVELKFRDLAWDALAFDRAESTTNKGDKAVRLVKSMLKHGLLPLPSGSRVVEEKDMQVEGTDILVHANQLRERDVRIQVKCDFYGGRRELGGTGNLFLQVRERNPFGYN
jgi:hypothetical protein